LSGVVERLDHLNDGSDRSLSVAGIWLTPVYPSPNFDWGYDVADYVDIHPDFGTLDDFDRLIDEAQERGIRVVMDLVANHTSFLHPWFQESRSSRDNPRRDWYMWRDAPAGGGYPNNWTSVFGGGSGWEWDEHTDQFYYHAFLKEQPDLNWQNPEVREAIAEVMRFWMRRGVAGFRLDAIAHIGKDPNLPDNPLKPGVPEDAGGEWNNQIHEFDQACPVMVPWLRELRSIANEYGALLVGEIYSLSPGTLARFAGDRELHSVFNFDMLTSPWNGSAFKAAVDGFEGPETHGVWPSPVIDNHDNPRSFTRWDRPDEGRRRAAVAAMMLLTLRGTPYLYYGQEIGMANVDVPRERLRDPVGRVGWPAEKGRDGERTPMQWDPGPYSGFSAVEPWLPVSPEAATVNVDSEGVEPGSLLNLYRRLGWLRTSHPALHRGAYRSIESGVANVWVFLREAEGERLLVVLNFGKGAATLDLSALGGVAELLLATEGRVSGSLDLRSVQLSGICGRILRLSPDARGN